MRDGNSRGPASPWKHKAKVLIAFVALCAAAAFSGIGYAADRSAPAAPPSAQIFR